MADEKFHFGAEVFTSDGKRVGELRRTLVKSETFELEGLVVEEDGAFNGALLSPDSMLFCPDVAVPLSAVGEASRERIDLKLTSAQVRALPPYITYAAAEQSTRQEVLQAVRNLGGPTIPAYDETLHKPEDEIEIEQGDYVMLGHSGHKLGEVKEVLFDGDELVGVVMQPGGLFKQQVILPRRFLGRSDDAALFANLSDEDLKQLKPYRPES